MTLAMQEEWWHVAAFVWPLLTGALGTLQIRRRPRALAWVITVYAIATTTVFFAISLWSGLPHSELRDGKLSIVGGLMLLAGANLRRRDPYPPA